MSDTKGFDRSFNTAQDIWIACYKEKDKVIVGKSSEGIAAVLPLLFSLQLLGLLSFTAFSNLSSLGISISVDAAFLTTQIGSIYSLFPSKITSTLPAFLLTPSPAITALLLTTSALFTYSFISSILTFGKATLPPKNLYPLGVYDAPSAQNYFDTKPLLTLSHALEIGWKSGSLSVKLGLDYL
eukprot:7302190-Ditylum_brightwellii.AAC.1